MALSDAGIALLGSRQSRKKPLCLKTNSRPHPHIQTMPLFSYSFVRHLRGSLFVAPVYIHIIWPPSHLVSLALPYLPIHPNKLPPVLNTPSPPACLPAYSPHSSLHPQPLPLKPSNPHPNPHPAMCDLQIWLHACGHPVRCTQQIPAKNTDSSISSTDASKDPPSRCHTYLAEGRCSQDRAREHVRYIPGACKECVRKKEEERKRKAQEKAERKRGRTCGGGGCAMMWEHMCRLCGDLSSQL